MRVSCVKVFERTRIPVQVLSSMCMYVYVCACLYMCAYLYIFVCVLVDVCDAIDMCIGMTNMC